jgi:hypothetical protein
MRNRVFIVVTPLLTLLAVVLNALGALDVSIIAPAVLKFLSGLLLFAVGLGLSVAGVYTPIDRPRWRAVASSGLLTIVILLMLDVTFGGHALLTALVPFTTDWPAALRRAARLAAVGSLTLLVFAAVKSLWRHVAGILFVVASVLFVTTLVINSGLDSLIDRRASDRGPGAPGAPAVIYIFLDEMLGPEGIDRQSPSGEVLYRALRETLDTHGFRTYGQAFSRHSYTEKSIANVVNFVADDDSPEPPPFYAVSAPAVLTTNALFDEFTKRGLNVRVFQTPHLNFCDVSAVATCLTLPSFNPVSAYMDSAADTDASVATFFKSLFPQSYLLYFYAQWMERVFPPPFHGVPVPHLDAYAFVRWFDHIIAETRQARRGDAYFAHVVAPHAPHLLDSACTPQRRWTLPYSLQAHRDLPTQELDALRKTYDGWYNEQATCVVKRLGVFLEAVDQSPHLRDATVIIQGDHGSRVSTTRYWQGLGPEDLVANHSTLFAARAPGVAAGYDLRLVSVQELAGEFFGRATSSGVAPSVALEAPNGGHPVIWPMPEFANGHPTEPWMAPGDKDVPTLDARPPPASRESP